MKNLKKLTLLHSNDMHGDFMAEQVDDKLMGGISRLSGYIQKVRREEENVLYAIAGDMFRGSLIDSEYKGLSTIEMMNLLGPDVVTLGNHEVDYGLAHLLFIEKCAKFPIINANMYITMNHKRLFRSHVVLEVDGMKILFIGILTDAVLNSTRQDKLIGSLVDLEAAVDEVGRICNAYKTTDIDFTVLLTHIGFETDKELAAALDPAWGVDVIIGGHSHTLLSEPAIVAGIPVVQAAKGTDQIGRFDIMIDTDKNAIDSFTWQLIPIDAEHCPKDEVLEEVLQGYKKETDRKYGSIVTRFAECYTHPVRNRETSLGKLIADAFRDELKLDIMLLGSGSVRRESMGPIVTRRDIMEVMPFQDSVYLLTLTGKQLRHMVDFALRRENDEESEQYQYSQGFCVEYDLAAHRILSMKFRGQEVKDEDVLRVGLQGFHVNNLKEFLDVTPEEVSAIAEPKIVSTSCLDLVEEYFSGKEYVKASPERRLIMR